VAAAVPQVSSPQVSPLEALDQIAEKAGSLDGFLSNAQIQDEYFHALAKYYGESRFPRQSFDVILQQLEELVALVPEAKERIWEKRAPQAPLVLETLEAPEGLQLNAQGWQKFRAHWTEQLRKDSKSIHAILSERARHDHVNAILKKLDQRIQSFNDELSASHMPRRVQEERSFEFFSALRNDPAFKEVTSYLVLEQLQSEKVAEYFRSQDPSLILCGLDELQNANAPQGVKIPDSLRPLIKTAAPTPESVLVNSEVFHLPESLADGRSGRALKRQTWNFSEPSRLLHTLWRGVPFKECLGGSCDHLDETTARRWAVSLLRGARVQNLDRGDRFLGFVQTVPVQKGDERFASLEVIAPDMKRSVLVRVKGETTYSPKTLFNAWYQNAIKHLPQGTQGFVIGAGESFLNGEGYASIYSSAAFLNGKEIGVGDEMSPLDFEFERKVAAASKNENLVKIYGGSRRMIFETRDYFADQITLLSSGDVPEEALRSAKEARKVFQGPVEGKIRLLAALAYQEWSPEMKELLREERATIFKAAETHHPAAVKFLDMANPSAFYTLFKVEFTDPPTSEQFMRIEKDIQTIKKIRGTIMGNIPQQIARLFQKQIIPFVRSAPTLEDILKIRPVLREANDIELEISFMNAALDRASSPAQFTAVLEANVSRGMTPRYKHGYNDLIRESIPKLLRLNPPPTVADIAHLMSRRGQNFDLTNRELIAREGLRLSQNANDFVRIISFYGMSPESQEEKELQVRLIRENIDQFLKFNPGPDQIHTIEYLAPGAIQRHQSSSVHSTDPGCIIQNLGQSL
jgi:hypothetical protein